jgi:hypothetical protein
MIPEETQNPDATPEEIPTTPPTGETEIQPPAEPTPAAVPEPVAEPTPVAEQPKSKPRRKRRRKASLLNTCNVLDGTRGHQQFWRFAASGRGMKLVEVLDNPDPQALVPDKFTRRDASQMWDPHCQNDAWLPMEKVFFRVLRLPICEPEELAGMVELQLEKISPLAVSQVVWTFETVPPPPGVTPDQQVVVVIMAERAMVEDQLAQLESIGYRPDRLEVPVLQQVLSAREEVDQVDGAWIYPRIINNRPVCLVAWWAGGELCNINVAHLSSPEHLNELTEHLTASAWAAELEGWAPAAWQWHLVADRELAEQWLPLLNEWAGRGVQPHDPPETAALAAACAHHAARPLEEANLLPLEYRDRFHRDDVDRVWLNVAGWMLAAYAIFVGVYFFALGNLRDEQDKEERSRRKLQREHKGMALEEERFLKKREYDELGKKALECLQAVAVSLPTDMQLLSMNFNDRKESKQNLTLSGNVPTDLDQLVGTFKDNMSGIEVENLDHEKVGLFADVLEGSIVEIPIAGDPVKRWSLTCELVMNREKRKKDNQ